jgi:hypothetical protein
MFFADPWADELPTVEELEEKYGKKVAESSLAEDSVEKDEVETAQTDEMTSTKIVFEENPVEPFNSW